MPNYYVTATPTLHTSKTSVGQPSTESSYWSSSFLAVPDGGGGKGSPKAPARDSSPPRRSTARRSLNR
jgi:hypothetical protein